MENLVLEMTIDNISAGSRKPKGYIPLLLDTNRGRVEARYYHIRGQKNVVVFVGGGLSGGFESPANNLYEHLSQSLSLYKIGALHIKFRESTDLIESALDVLAGITFLERFGITDITLVGHSFGGPVIIQAAAAAPENIRTIVTLSSQPLGGEAVKHLPNIPLLLIHGTKDRVFPPYASSYIHAIATSEKKLLLIPGANHFLDEAAEEIFADVKQWIIKHTVQNFDMTNKCN